MRPRRLGLLTLATAAALSCDRADRAPAPDTVTRAEPLPAPAPRTWEGTWAPALGDLLIVPSDSETVLVVYPDDPAAEMIASAPVTLLGPAGDTVTRETRLTLVDTLQCGDTEVARLASAAPAGWTMGLRGASAASVRLDSIESLSARDSARAVAEIARLASAVEGPSHSRFTGLPFAVIGARRFTLDAAGVLVAHVVRRLPQEAAPLEEHTLIVAERKDASAPYTLAYSQQSEGSEETAKYFDVVGVARAGRTVFLILAGDASARTEYQILERSSAGAWRVRWTRPLSC